ncbi:MAG TPA: c-type cytochrome [Propylenella sp.]|nr:c-type cytochrome [Propylenella sp.]
MKLALKLLAFVLVVLVAAAGTIYGVSEYRLRRNYAVEPAPVTIPSDAAAVERGARLAKIRGCRECHGDDLGGAVVVEDPAAGKIYGVNLTRGRGGLPADYAELDFLRAVRHGVARDGRPLILMPSSEFAALSDQDIGDIIAFVRSVPAVDREMPRSTLGPIMRAVLVFDERAELLTAEHIDHSRRAPVPSPANQAEQGRYLAVSCLFCHGEGFSGGKIPGTPPDFPPAANLTPGGAIRSWTEAQFVTALRTGVTPDGRKLDPRYMPWTALQAMTDAEIHALWEYLRGLPPKADGNR